MPSWLVTLPDRLDTFIAKELAGMPRDNGTRVMSRSQIQAAIREGKVMVNDDVTRKPAQRLQEGDRVSMPIEERHEEKGEIVPLDLQLPILYEDAVCFVINKPAGIAVHPGAGMALQERTILDGIAFLFRERKIPFSPEAVLVHRLDKETTGCLLIAKSREAHEFLQHQFEERSIKKTYLALVAGIPSPLQAIIDAPLGRSVFDRTKMSILGAAGARTARTSYRTLGKNRDIALLACEPETGRTHQIRVHLSSIGHPILGDSTYTSPLSEQLTEELGIRSLCLHAWKLRFVSPADEREHEVIAPPPRSFEEILETIGMRM